MFFIAFLNYFFSWKMAFMLTEKIVLLDWKLFLFFLLVLSEGKKNVNCEAGLSKVQIKSTGQ